MRELQWDSLSKQNLSHPPNHHILVASLNAYYHFVDLIADRRKHSRSSESSIKRFHHIHLMGKALNTDRETAIPAEREHQNQYWA